MTHVLSDLWLWTVVRRMVRRCHYLEVLDTVVVWHAISVVYHLVRFEFPTEMHFHHLAMRPYALPRSVGEVVDEEHMPPSAPVRSVPSMVHNRLCTTVLAPCLPKRSRGLVHDLGFEPRLDGLSIRSLYQLG